MPRVHELIMLYEILDVCYKDLHHILMCDHPPRDIFERIEKERNMIFSIENLILDLKTDIARKELYNYHRISTIC